MSERKKKTVSHMASCLEKKDLFLHFISALASESYLYAGILRDEIQSRSFTNEELNVLKNSSFYPRLNGILG